MPVIKDIRLFESSAENVDGTSLPGYIGKILDYDFQNSLPFFDRLLFWLRNKNFAFPDFDHLYLNYCTALPHGEVNRSKRSVCSEDKWLRFAEIGCDRAKFNSWSEQEKENFISGTAARTFALFTSDEMSDLAHSGFDAVRKYGADLEIPYKEKSNDRYKVCVSVKITDDLDFLPRVAVYDLDGNAVADEQLPPLSRDSFIAQFGAIKIGARRVRIDPRKGTYWTFFDTEKIVIKL